MAPAHIGHGSLVTKRSQSVSRQSPTALSACVMASISAWAVASFSVSTWFHARRDDFTIPNDDRANRHLVRGESLARKAQRLSP